MAEMEIRSAVVTGPTGALGHALVEVLARAGIRVFAAVHPGSPRNARLFASPLVQQVPCELSDLLELSARIGAPVDAFFHLAWLGTQQRENRMDMYLQNTNVRYALDAVHAAGELGAKVFVGAGSQAEYGRVDGVLRPELPAWPENGYGMAKLCAGQMTRALCRQLGIRHIWPRVVSVYGPSDGSQTLVSTVMTCLMAGKSPRLTPGSQLWDYLYAGDAARAFLAMARRGRNGALYVVASGHSRPLRDFMQEIQQVVNPLVPLDIGALPYLAGQVMHLEADVSLLVRDTGWQPEVRFTEGIRMTWNEMCAVSSGGAIVRNYRTISSTVTWQAAFPFAGSFTAPFFCQQHFRVAA